jgi:beta-exotoxin I transport system permease protein
MLLRNVFTKTVRDLRWPTFWVAVALAVGGGYFTALYNTYVQTFDLAAMMDKMPPAMKELIGGSDLDLSTATGFLNIELFPLILPALLAGFAIAMGSGFTAGEESKGTIDVLLSYPVPRWQMVLEKVAALAIAMVVIAVLMLLGIEAGSIVGNAPVDLDKVAAGLVLATLLSLAFGTMALTIAALTGNRSAAAGVPIGLIVVMYLVQSLSAQIETLRSVNWLSLFHYYLGGNPLKNGLDLGNTAVLAAVALVFLVAALAAFERRDIAA